MNEVESGPEQTRGSETPESPATQGALDDRSRETNMWAMFIHFSVLAGWVVPLAGLVVPVMLWQLKKDDLPGTVPHAHIVLNWIVTSLVYGLICFILAFVVIGIFGFIALGLATILFSIIGGVKANNGEIWEYPGTIVKIFK